MSEPIRVLVISFKFWPEYAGWLQQTLSMIEASDPHQTSFTWITPQKPGNESGTKVWKNLDVHHIGSSYTSQSRLGRLLFGVKIAKYLIQNRKKYDVIFCPLAYTPTEIVVTISRILHKPTVVRIAQGEISTSYFMGRFRRRFFSSLATKLVVLNKSLFESLELAASHKVQWFPNGVDIERFQPAINDEKTELRERWKIRESQPVILFVGAMVPRKGVDTLVSAFIQVAKDNKDSLLLLAGPTNSQTEFFNEIKLQVAKFGLEHRIRFLGHTSTVEDLMRAADIFVLPSHAEGMPNVLLEALATGLPCIASNIPGVQELIIPNHNGLLFPPKSVQELANQLRFLLDHDDARQEIGKQACQTIVEKFSIRQTAKRYQELFAQVAE